MIDSEFVLASDELVKGPIFLEKNWYYFHCPKNVLRSILTFVFWIFPPSDPAVQLKSADSKQNTIWKYLSQDSFWHILWAMRKMHHTFWKIATFMDKLFSKTLWNYRQFNFKGRIDNWFEPIFILDLLQNIIKKWFSNIPLNFVNLLTP